MTYLGPKSSIGKSKLFTSQKDTLTPLPYPMIESLKGIEGVSEIPGAEGTSVKKKTFNDPQRATGSGGVGV